MCKDGTYKWILDRGKIIERDDEGKPLRIVGTTTDITKRKKAEQELLQSEGKLQAIFKGSNDAIILLTENGFFDCNPKALEMFDIQDKEELIKLHPHNISPEFQLDGQKSDKKADEMIQIALKKGVNRFEWIHKRKNEEIFPAEVLLSAFEYGGEMVIQATVQDITERKKAEEAIIQNEEKYRSLIENSPEIILIVNKDEKVEFSNFANTRYDAQEIIGHDLYEFVFDQHHEMIREAHRKVFEGEKSQSYETQGTNIDGERVWYLTHVGPKYFNNEVVGLVLFIKNITDRKLAEEKIKQSLHEKEVLLKEVHHRVKNNLQIISSILNLQSSTISDKYILDLLKNSQDRIRSMSLIHELLYQTKDFSTINFLEYIRSISTNLFQSYNQNQNIDLVLELQPVALDLDLAIPCGLIINELITNSLKYAFEITGSGEVKIILSQSDDEVKLIIEDNGKGFPSTIDFRDTESLGMQLVVSLVDQIDGEIKLESDSGTKYELRFKNVLTGAERLS
jgi:PAS domain S-box-containing protein